MNYFQFILQHLCSSLCVQYDNFGRGIKTSKSLFAINTFSLFTFHIFCSNGCTNIQKFFIGVRPKLFNLIYNYNERSKNKIPTIHQINVVYFEYSQNNDLGFTKQRASSNLFHALKTHVRLDRASLTLPNVRHDTIANSASITNIFNEFFFKNFFFAKCV